MAFDPYDMRSRAHDYWFQVKVTQLHSVCTRASLLCSCLSLVEPYFAPSCSANSPSWPEGECHLPTTDVGWEHVQSLSGLPLRSYHGDRRPAAFMWFLLLYHEVFFGEPQVIQVIWVEPRWVIRTKGSEGRWVIDSIIPRWELNSNINQGASLVEGSHGMAINVEGGSVAEESGSAWLSVVEERLLCGKL